MKSTNSEYIGFVNTDDFIHPMMYKLLIKEAESYGSDVAFCGYERVPDGAIYDALPANMKHLTIGREDVIHWDLSDEERMEIMASHEYGRVWGQA